MFRSLAPISKLNTDIFHGQSSSRDMNGGIEIIGNGNMASITFTDKNRRETKATIKVYKLRLLKKSHDFKNSTEEASDENLINTWKTRRGSNTIIKYSGNDQLAFVFSSDGNIDEAFLNLLSHREFYRIDYLNEIKFYRLLQDQAGLSIDQLRDIPGISEKRVQLLFESSSALAALLSHEVTIKQLASLNDELFQLLLKTDSVIKRVLNLGLTMDQLQHVNLAKLSNCMDNSWELEDALKFVTIEQILGINHNPKRIADGSASRRKSGGIVCLGGFGGGSGGGYIHEHDDNSITIEHEQSGAKLSIKFGALKDEARSVFDKAIEELELVELIHKWYAFPAKTTNGQRKNIFYCPELQLMHLETIDLSFPEDDFRNGYNSYLLLSTTYYKENEFIKYLKERGHSLLELKQIPGMSLQKLELLCAHEHDLAFLLKAGISMPDFAKVELNRLTYILENSIKAERALKFVDARELLGIHGMIRRHSQGLFVSPSPSPSAPSNNVMEIDPKNILH